MEHSSSVSSAASGAALALDEAGKSYLLALADAAIRAGLDRRAMAPPDLEAAPLLARQSAAVFVTVTVAGDLNGCIGTMEPETLGIAVPRLAYQAAFEDPRLSPLSAADYPRMAIKISVLTPMEPIDARSEDELLAQLRPGVDGLLIQSGWHRATFLPAVWDTLHDPQAFLHHLELKAGLRPGQWPSDLKAFRYTSEEFGTGH